MAAIYSAVNKMRGAYAFGIMFADRVGELFAIRCGSPLIVGLGEDGNFIASDVSAFSDYSDRYIRLDEGETVRLCPYGYEVRDLNGNEIDKPVLKNEFYKRYNSCSGGQRVL